jgi:hypothetical protein
MSNDDDDDDDDDITFNYHRGNHESMIANTRTNKVRDRARIIAWLATQGLHGGTCYEARIELGMLHQTCSARFSELKKDKVIVPNGKQRLTNTGSPAAVCVLVLQHEPESFFGQLMHRKDDGHDSR